MEGSGDTGGSKSRKKSGSRKCFSPIPAADPWCHRNTNRRIFGISKANSELYPTSVSTSGLSISKIAPADGPRANFRGSPSFTGNSFEVNNSSHPLKTHEMRSSPSRSDAMISIDASNIQESCRASSRARFRHRRNCP